MKIKRISFIIFFSLLIGVHTYAQSIKAVIGAGTNFAQVDGDEVYGFKKIGLNVAAQAMVPIYTNFFATLELNYNEKGAFQKSQNNDPIYTGEYHLRLKYVEVPVLLQYNDKDIFTVGLGVSYARLIDTFEEEHSGNLNPYSDSIAFNDNDYSLMFDLQFRLYRKIYMNLRYSYSLKPIRERTFNAVSTSNQWTRSQYNNCLMVRLNYRINEKKRSKSGLDIE